MTGGFAMKWSSSGPISGKQCVQLLEASDPHTSADNYLCYTINAGARGPGPGRR